MRQIVNTPTKLKLEQQRAQLPPGLLHRHHGDHELFALAQPFEFRARGIVSVSSFHIIPQGLALGRCWHVFDDALSLIGGHCRLVNSLHCLGHIIITHAQPRQNDPAIVRLLRINDLHHILLPAPAAQSRIHGSRGSRLLDLRLKQRRELLLVNVVAHPLQLLVLLDQRPDRVGIDPYAGGIPVKTRATMRVLLSLLRGVGGAVSVGGRLGHGSVVIAVHDGRVEPVAFHGVLDGAHGKAELEHFEVFGVGGIPFEGHASGASLRRGLRSGGVVISFHDGGIESVARHGVLDRWEGHSELEHFEVFLVLWIILQCRPTITLRNRL
mmetsp:Transcript_10002/g.21637  ORF Transcript_10002/g.21637 Transcript_10002/m.21637 type:complete len:325 (-) Transcript_10002:935-1909(-)